MDNEQLPDGDKGTDIPDSSVPTVVADRVEQVHQEARKMFGFDAPSEEQIRLAIHCGIDVKGMDASAVHQALDAAQEDGVIASWAYHRILHRAAKDLGISDEAHTNALRQQVHDAYKRLQTKFPVGSIMKWRGEPDDRKFAIVSYGEDEYGFLRQVTLKSVLRGNAWTVNITSLMNNAEMVSEGRNEHAVSVDALMRRIRSHVDVVTRDTTYDLTTARNAAKRIAKTLQGRRYRDRELTDDLLDDVIREHLGLGSHRDER